jgi:DnaJ-class molecular chaperone
MQSQKTKEYFDVQNVFDGTRNMGIFRQQLDFIAFYCEQWDDAFVGVAYLKLGKYPNEAEIRNLLEVEYDYEVRFGPRGKDIDTVLAADLLDDAKNDIFKIAVLVSGDTDFVAPIEIVKKWGKAVHVLCVNGNERVTGGIMAHATKSAYLPRACPACSGSGKITQSCPACKGGWVGTGFCVQCRGTGSISTPCKKCDATGIHEIATCWSCQGTGQRFGNPCPACGGVGQFVKKCFTCEGTGRFEVGQCPNCGGQGWVPFRNRRECPTCHGAGNFQVTCSQCAGTGVTRN